MQIIRVGTGEGGRESVRAADDPMPEYVADELLVMTQGLDPERGGKSDSGDDFQEWRDPGKYGRYGWTETAGMPLWRPGDREGGGTAKGKPAP